MATYLFAWQRSTCHGAGNYTNMQQAHSEPLYWAKDRVPFNLTLVLALGIAVWGAGATFGLWDMGGNPQIILVLGVGVAAYTWLFTPRAYLVYQDALCVSYGRPRVKVMHFSNIAVVEMGSLATLDQLRVRPVKGRRQSIRVRDPETFFDELESALNAYRDAHPEENFAFQFTGRMPQEVAPAAEAGVIDVEPVAVTDANEAQPDEAAGELQEAATETTTEATTEEPAPATEAASAEAEPSDQPEQSDQTSAAEAAEEREKPPEPEHRPLY